MRSLVVHLTNSGSGLKPFHLHLLAEISEESSNLSSCSVATLADKSVAARALEDEQRWQRGFIEGEEQAAHRRDMKYCEIT